METRRHVVTCLDSHRCWNSLDCRRKRLQRQTATVPAPAAKPPVSMRGLPATDEGLPGGGPIRRGEWFRPIWNGRRTAWSRRTQEDQGALVFLGDSITQGWGDDFGEAFAGVKLANRGISGDTTRGMLIRLDEDVLELNPRGS